MLNDCRAGKIDLILTKSISRFARNTADCLQMVRELTVMGVSIWFEKENIHTGTMESEFMLSIMAGFAQDESKSISNNLKWGVHRRFEAGTYKTSEAPYGYKREGMNYVIVPEEAAVVKEVFSMLLSGKGMTDIAKTLNERGTTARNGGRWFNAMVRKIIHNREYTGDAIYQKSYMDDQYKQRKNRGEVDQYVNADHHEQIISREDFEKAAHVMERNRIESSGGRKSAFSGLLFCGKCGSPMHRKVKNGQVRYFCSGRRGGGIDCDNETEMEINIRNTFLTCLNKLAFSQRQREGRIIDTFILMIAEKEREKHAERITEIDSILAAHALEMNTMDALACIDVYREEQRKRKAVILREDRLLREEKEHLLSDPGTMENQQVKRNIERFDEDYRFQLTREEVTELSISQNVTSIQLKGIKGGRSKLPWAFTEAGIYMLMTVLKGDLAVHQSKTLIRVLQALKDYVVETQGMWPRWLLKKIESLLKTGIALTVLVYWF